MESVLGSHEDWMRHGSSVRVGQHDIFWRQDGDPGAEPVTLLHGFPTSSHDWAAVVSMLAAAGYRTTTLDFLGFGASSKPNPYTYRLREQADIVEAVWSLAGISRTALVVHDYGVTVGQELLARDPGRFSSVSFLNGGVYPELHRPIAVQRLLHGRLGTVIGHLSSERTFRMAMAKITGAPLSGTDVHSMWQAITMHKGKRVQHHLLRYIDERRSYRERWVTAMESFGGPLQFIWGPEDPISGAHVLARLRERLETAHFTELDGIGHYPQLESPAAVGAALTDFLSGAGSR